MDRRVQQDTTAESAMGADIPVPPARPIRPVPRRSLRPWAGHRLGEPGEQVGELWVAGPDSLVELADGPRTLDELAATAGEALVGSRAMRRYGLRFPLLVKLIDAGEWLSLQVHPGDALAAELFGERAIGKTEAWLVLDAADDAVLVTGPRRGLADAELLDAIRDGAVGLAHCETRPAIAGETLLLHAGTMHAIGAGAFVYEIEQPSDITFRMSDWGRPATPERHLHVAEALRAIDPRAHAEPAGTAWALEGGALEVPELRLEILEPAGAMARTPAGSSVEVLTVIAGEAQVRGDGWRERLTPFETLVVPAAVPRYEILGEPGTRLCVGSIP
jgi:mannose-6-phosphate isomerase